MISRRSHPRILVALFLLLTVAFPVAVLAQDVTPTDTPASGETAAPTGDIPQVHAVQEGETLTSIALTYDVTVEALLAVNNLANGDLLQIGQELLIPGGTGKELPGVYTVRLGDTLRSVAGDYNTSVAEVVAANRLVQLRPELRPGQQLAVVSRTGTDQPRPMTGRPHLVTQGETLLTIASAHNLSPLALAAANEMDPGAPVFAGQRLRIPDDSVQYRDLPAGWVELRVRPGVVNQGSTVSVYVQNLEEGVPEGWLDEQPLQFTPFGRGYVALLGVDAFTEPGSYELAVRHAGEAEPSLQYDLPIVATAYDTQYINVGEALDGLLDPALRAEEDAFLKTLFAQFNDTQWWNGPFQLPVPNAFVSAGYGGRRSYNGGPIEIYHTGTDYAAPVGTPVLAPADGVVVFSDELELRGGAVIIDHGLGIMTGYYHLSERLVEVGDEVVAGQEFSKVGNTGLSSGPHLHWDLRVMDVPVDPLRWTEQAFP